MTGLQPLSTADAPRGTRAAWWNALYSERFGNVTFSPAGAGEFAAELALGAVGPLGIARIRATATNIERTPAHVERGGARLFSFLYVARGSGVFEHNGNITVLRSGALVGEYKTTELLRIDLVQKMLGRSPGEIATRTPLAASDKKAPVVLTGTGLTVKPGIVNANVELVEGEVLGLAGLLGSGRTELAKAITAVDHLDSGTLTVTATGKSPRTPRQAIFNRVAYSPENRRTDGIIDRLSVEARRFGWRHRDVFNLRRRGRQGQQAHPAPEASRVNSVLGRQYEDRQNHRRPGQ